MAFDLFNPSSATVLTAMIAGGVASVAYAAVAWHRRVQTAEQAKHWPASDGEILSSEVIVHPSYDDDVYEARVSYAYRAGGRRLVGDRLRVGARIKSPDEALVRAAVAPYRAGDRARVHYDPAKPERSVLETVPTPIDLKVWLIGGLFVLAASAFIAVTLTFPSPF